VIKKRLYSLLRTLLSRDWYFYLPIIVDHVNATKSRSLGFMAPSDILRPEQDSLVRKLKGVTEESVNEMVDNQEEYNTGIHVHREYRFFLKGRGLSAKKLHPYDLKN
jgi:hypothetical protein